MTTSFEELFNKCVLSVVAPRASLGLIRQKDAPNASEEWLNRLEDEATDRKMAFFGKVLTLMLELALGDGTVVYIGGHVSLF